MNKKKITKEFKKLILKKATIKKSDSTNNIKLGKMGSWMELPGDIAWFIPELGVWCNGTCGKHCKGCFNHEDPRKSPCYVLKSIYQKTKRNEDGTVGNIVTNECTVKLGQAYRTLAMTLFRDELLINLDLQLTRMKDKFSVIRINESGELTCYEDLYLWCELARRHPETVFYLYTKNYDAVAKALSNEIICNNIFINISVWHEYGINEYKQFANKCAQIRAYVLVDSEWNIEKYSENGLVIESMCPAYDQKGKMNHNVTCDKCGKTHCHSRINKITGCYSH